jgi:hypothetical protein
VNREETQPDVQELPLVVPLVQGFAGGQALVALQADERRVQGLGQCLGRGRLADTGLALQQQRLAEAQGQEDGHGQAVVGQVVDGVQALDDLFRIVHSQ